MQHAVRQLGGIHNCFNRGKHQKNAIPQTGIEKEQKPNRWLPTQDMQVWLAVPV